MLSVVLRNMEDSHDCRSSVRTPSVDVRTLQVLSSVVFTPSFWFRVSRLVLPSCAGCCCGS